VATRLERLRVFAPAKINLFLHVARKRADGFHDLQSLVAFADIGDVLTVERAPRFSLELDGPFAAALAGAGDNLVLRAARSLAAHLALAEGARFTLTKNLPVASGIGGGSADAAAALRGLLALWSRRDRDSGRLDALTAGLGSDVPVCLLSRAAWMEGRGERVLALPQLPPSALVLVNPGVSVATAEVFRHVVCDDRSAGLNPPGEFAAFGSLVRYLDTTRNALEAPARAIAPVIGEVLEALSRSGAPLVRMSGSGATCFGLFETMQQADSAAAAIVKSRPHWWTRAARFATLHAGEPVRQD
jgi:4-diphosphocytidyl-2-C-methyl-D-erythritol kinase